MGSDPTDPIFRPEVLLNALAERGVEVIVVGAFAAEVWGVRGMATRDLDLVPDPASPNLQNLADVLCELAATVRIENHSVGPVALPPDGGLIAKTPILNLHLQDVGDVDVIHAASSGSDGRERLDWRVLVSGARPLTLPGAAAPVLVMSEEHWAAAKLAPPIRPKDRAHLDVYLRWRAGDGT